MLFIRGLTLTSTIHASLLLLCTPLLITISAIWVLKEKITVYKILGLALGVGGAALLVLSKDPAGSSASSMRGDLFIMMNAIFYTIYFVMVKPLMEVYQPMQVVRWVFTFGIIFIIPFGWNEFRAIPWELFSTAHWVSLASIIFAGTFLAYLFNVYGIRHLGAGITGSYIYTQPVFASLVATLFLGEHFTWEKLVAGLLIFSGVFLVSRKSVPVIQE